MQQIDDQYFETINIQTIRYRAFASGNTLEIRIENETYAEERMQKMQQILIVVICCAAFNAFNSLHSLCIVLNAIFFIAIFTQTYILANLINLGEHKKLRWCLYSVWVNNVSPFTFFYFAQRNCPQ